MNFILVHSVCSHLGTVEICHSKRLMCIFTNWHKVYAESCVHIRPCQELPRTALARWLSHQGACLVNMKPWAICTAPITKSGVVVHTWDPSTGKAERDRRIPRVLWEDRLTEPASPKPVGDSVSKITNNSDYGTTDEASTCMCMHTHMHVGIHTHACTHKIIE